MRTSEVVPLVKGLVKFAVVAVLLFLAFRFASFSLRQAVVLTLLVLVGYDLYKTAVAKATPAPFSPYRVIVAPKFHELLLDYKLIENVEELRCLHGFWEKKDQHNLCFTVLKPQSAGEWLIYSDTYKYFLSDMKIEEPIEALAFRTALDQEHTTPVYLRDPSLELAWNIDCPAFYFRQAVAGYEVGLSVHGAWWKAVCAENPDNQVTKTTCEHNGMTDETRLKIATLPYAAFALFHTGPEDYEHLDNVWEHMDAQLAVHGWKRKKPDPHAEVSDPWIRIEHKYFFIQYTDI